MNHIEEFRRKINAEFDKSNLEQYGNDSSLSPSSRFCVDTIQYYSLSGQNFRYTKVEIRDMDTGVSIFNFLVNDDCYHGWLVKNDKDFLVCAEDIFGGQTIINVTDRIMESYSPADDGFIWTDFHLSPDGNTLAVLGCYWACPTVMKLFDFSNPLQLPLPEIKEIELLDNDEIITGWIDNNTIQMKGVKRERVAEYSDGGSFRMRTVSETKIEREIKI